MRVPIRANIYGSRVPIHVSCFINYFDLKIFVTEIYRTGCVIELSGGWESVQPSCDASHAFLIVSLSCTIAFSHHTLHNKTMKLSLKTLKNYQHVVTLYPHGKKFHLIQFSIYELVCKVGSISVL